MKKITAQLLILVLGMLTANHSAEAQIGSSYWTFSNPKPFGFTGLQIAYADDNNAVVVGTAGGIAKTTDGGATWTYFSYVTSNASGEITVPTFNDIQFVNSSLAFAVGSNGIMIKSIDGGTNWSNITTPFFAEGIEINSVHFLNASTGYIGGVGDAITKTSTLYKTIDGGNTWQTAFVFPPPPQSWQTEPTAILKIRFTPSGVGYVGCTGGFVWKYDNAVWTDYSITPATIFPNVNALDTAIIPHSWDDLADTLYTTYSDNVYGLAEQNYRALALINDTAILVGAQNNGGIIRINTSTAAGSYWLLNNGNALAPRYAPVGSPQVYNFATRDGITIAGTGSFGKFLKSTDRGYSIQSSDVYPASSSEGEIDFYGIGISPSNRFGLCGRAGIIADSVTSWRKPFVYTKKSLGFFSGYSLQTISFADANNGVAAGARGTMLRTANGGDTWEDVSNAGFNDWDAYTSVAFTSPASLLASATNGMFYKSVDRGSSFDLLFVEPNNANLSAIHFNNEDTGWMIANVTYTDQVTYENSYHKIIYRTTDGGTTWDSSNTVFPIVPQYSVWNDIKFANALVGYVAGDNGIIYKSIDGGLTWVLLTNIPAFAADKSISSLSVVDENIVYASGEQGLVMKTTNGGGTWTVCNTGLQTGFARYPKILMYDASQGLVFSSGVVYSTTNGGIGWSPFYTPVNDLLGAACFAPMAGCSAGLCKKAFAAGSLISGNILKFDSDKVLPVKFSNLTGTGTSRGNQLFWTAFSQEAVQYFEIERSADAVSFQKIGDKIYPNRFTRQAYQWLDGNIPGGRYFYRIKAVENSGAVYYTNTIVIASKKAAEWNYQLSNGNLILNNASLQKGSVLVQVINTAGQVVAAKSWYQAGGPFNDMLVLPPTAKGIHFVRINNEGAEKNVQLLIQ